MNKPANWPTLTPDEKIDWLVNEFNNHISAIGQGFAQQNKAISDLRTRVEALEQWKKKIDP